MNANTLFSTRHPADFSTILNSIRPFIHLNLKSRCGNAGYLCSSAEVRVTAGVEKVETVGNSRCLLKGRVERNTLGQGPGRGRICVLSNDSRFT